MDSVEVETVNRVGSYFHLCDWFISCVTLLQLW